MAIEKKLIHFNKKADFEKEKEAGNILDRSIVFIKDSKEIYNHGEYYAGNNTIFKIVEELPNEPAIGDENKIHIVIPALWHGDVPREDEDIVPNAVNISDNNNFNEYIWIKDKNIWELLGQIGTSSDLSKYITKEETDKLYQPKGNYLTSQDLTAYSKTADTVSAVAINGNYLRVTKNEGNTDLTIPYATSANNSNQLGGVAASSYLTTTVAANTYQPKGNYISLSDLDNYVKKSGDTMTGNLIMAGANISLGAAGGNSNSDSPIIRLNGNINTAQITGPSLRAINTATYGRKRLAIFQHAGDDYTSENEVFSILYNGNVGIGTVSPAYKLDVAGTGRFTGQLTSTVATGTAPISVTSTTVCPNLNAQYLNGMAGEDFALAKPNLTYLKTMNAVATLGNSMGMVSLDPTNNTIVNPSTSGGWWHYINLSYLTNTATNMWVTQFVIKPGTSEIYMRSRGGGSISDSQEWTQPWVQIATVKSNVASATTAASCTGNAATATTATNLSAAPTVNISGNTIAVTAGGKTSGYITVPYATNAGSASSASTATTASKLGAATLGGANTPIYLLNGVATSCNQMVNVAGTQSITGAKTFTEYATFSKGAGKSSDIRFKQNISPISDVLDKVMQLDIFNYKWVKDGDPEVETFGVSAQQLGSLGGEFAKMVHEADDKDKTKSVEYSQFGVVALKAIQEQQHIIADLSTQVRSQQKQLNDQQAQITELRTMVEQFLSRGV